MGQATGLNHIGGSAVPVGIAASEGSRHFKPGPTVPGAPKTRTYPGWFALGDKIRYRNSEEHCGTNLAVMATNGCTAMPVAGRMDLLKATNPRNALQRRIRGPSARAHGSIPGTSVHLTTNGNAKNEHSTGKTGNARSGEACLESPRPSTKRPCSSSLHAQD